MNVLRDAMAVDRLDPGGIYFGTTGGQVYALGRTAATAGRRSCAICRRCSRSRRRRCRDPRRASAPPAARLRASRRGLARRPGAADAAHGPRRAGGELSGPARDDSRSRDGEAPGLHPLLRVRAGHHARLRRRSAAGRGRLGSRSVPGVVGAMAGGWESARWKRESCVRIPRMSSRPRNAFRSWRRGTTRATVTCRRPGRVERASTTRLHVVATSQSAASSSVEDASSPIGDLPRDAGPRVGDAVVIPAGTPQRIANIGAGISIFYCVCSPRFQPRPHTGRSQRLISRHG